MKEIKLLVLLFTVFIAINACKKEKETNNPAIADAAIDKTIEAKYPTLINFIDINIDGEAIQDFEFVISHGDNDPDNHTVDLRVYDNKYQFLTKMIDDAIVINKVEMNSKIEPALSTWGGNTILLYHKFNMYLYGSTDIGDQYFAFRKRNTAGGYYYGWMKVNISNNGEKIEIIDYALNTVADTPIKAGEK